MLPPERLLPANPDILDGVDDLIQMSYLNEPSVLYNLQYRYSRDLIYVRTIHQALDCSWSSQCLFICVLLSLQTKAGPVLIAINPLKEVPLYGKDFIRKYRQKLTNDPHVYAIADIAFNEMLRGRCLKGVGSFIGLFCRIYLLMQLMIPCRWHKPIYNNKVRMIYFALYNSNHSVFKALGCPIFNMVSMMFVLFQW